MLHLVAFDVSRGAERYARALVDELNSRSGDRHLLMTLFDAEDDTINADIALDVPRGFMRRIGLDPRVVSGMRKVMRQLRPKAVIAHGGEPAKYSAVACRGVPYAYLVIGSSHPLLRNPVRRAMRRLYVGRAAMLVTVSEGLAAELVGESDVREVRVIRNGRDPDIYRPRGRSGTGIGRVLFIGHLDEQKRPQLFVEVMKEISRRGVAASAALVGGGPLRPLVESQVDGFDIEVLGPRDDVPEMLGESDLLVLTSRPPEGMPGVLIEAGMAGLPVVATDVPGVRDVVLPGITGLIVAVDDTKGLADSVEALLTDSATRSEMGKAAREHCIARFSLGASADAWEDVIEEMSR